MVPGPQWGRGASFPRLPGRLHSWPWGQPRSLRASPAVLPSPASQEGVFPCGSGGAARLSQGSCRWPSFPVGYHWGGDSCVALRGGLSAVWSVCPTKPELHLYVEEGCQAWPVHGDAQDRGLWHPMGSGVWWGGAGRGQSWCHGGSWGLSERSGRTPRPCWTPAASLLRGTSPYPPNLLLRPSL